MCAERRKGSGKADETNMGARQDILASLSVTVGWCGLLALLIVAAFSAVGGAAFGSEARPGAIAPASLGAVIKNISVGPGPVGIALDSANGDLFVPNDLVNSNNLTVISSSSGRAIASVALPYPSPPEPSGYDLPGNDIYDPATGNIYTNLDIASTSNMMPAGAVSVVNGASDTNVTMFYQVPDTAGAGGPIALDPTTGDIWVGDNNNFNVTSYNANSGAQTGTPVDFGQANYNPVGLCFDTANGNMYVTRGNSSGPSAPGDIVVINGASDAVVSDIPISGGSLEGCTVDTTNGDIYVLGNNYDMDMYVINGATNALIQTIPLPTVPVSVVFDSQNGYLYISNMDDNMTVVNGATNQVLGSIPLGPTSGTVNFPGPEVFDSSNGYIYVTVQAGGATGTPGWVSVVNPSASGSSGSLTGVSISGIPSSLAPMASVTLTAVPTCSGGPCPSGVTYSWALQGSTLGSLSSTSSASPVFTAGSATGAQVISVTAKLLGTSQLASGVITIGSGGGGTGTLSSVNIGGVPSLLAPNSSVVLSAQPHCGSGGCPANITYAWMLVGTPLGTLSAKTGATVTFTAGSTPGSQEIKLVATSNGTTQSVTQTISIGTSGGGGSASQGNGWTLWVVVGVVVAAGVALALIYFLKMRTKKRSPPAYQPTPQTVATTGYAPYQQPPPPGQPRTLSLSPAVWCKVGQ